MQQRQHDAERDALLDRQHDDRRGGGDDQQELAERLAVDRDDLLEADDAQRHEQQHAAERGVRHVAQQRGAKRQQRQHDRRGEQAASCDRPPVSATMPVRGGLALTGNAPNRPGEHAAGAGAEEIAIDIGGLVGVGGNERVVAAVCTITTMVISKGERHERAHCSGASSGNDGIGSVAGTAPTTLTPLLSSRP